MSARIADQLHFLSLLLDTDKKQRAAIFQTLTKSQTDALGEIFHNLIRVLPLAKEEQKLLKRKPFLRLVATTKTSPSRRKSILKKHYKQVIDLLLSFGDKILEVARLSPPSQSS